MIKKLLCGNEGVKTVEKILSSSCEANACRNPANKDHWQSDYKWELLWHLKTCQVFGNIHPLLNGSGLYILHERWHDGFAVQMFSLLYLSPKDWAYISHNYVWLQNECKKCSDLMALLVLQTLWRVPSSFSKFWVHKHFETHAVSFVSNGKYKMNVLFLCQNLVSSSKEYKTLFVLINLLLSSGGDWDFP